MSSKNSALASLTATYTDSENEENNYDSSSNSNSVDSFIKASKTSNPLDQSSSHNSKNSTPVERTDINPSKQLLSLVSYNDDIILSDDENTSPNHEVINMDISENEESVMPEPETEPQINKYAHYGFTLPPEPKSKPTTELLEKINSLYEKKESTNMDMNKIIQERKEFRNPSIYEKLIQFCDINEFGTNYPPEVYNPFQWGQESYYEELAKVQKIEMAKKEKEKKDKKKSDPVHLVKKTEEESKKRKSKWDQPAPNVNIVKSNIPPPALTSNVTGTKGTVISAFGLLPKKVNQ